MLRCLGLIGFSLVAFLACKQEKHVLTLSLPKIIREIPVYQNTDRAGSHIDAYLITNIKANQLGLDYIKSGFDSLLIRFWACPAPEGEKYLVELKRHNSEWAGKVICYTSGKYMINRAIVPLTLDSMKLSYIREVAPNSGWTVFLHRLDSLHLFNMKHSMDLQGYEEGKFETSAYYVEYARSQYYRFYYYEAPERFRHKHKNAEEIILIWETLKKELNIDALKNLD